MTCIIIHIECNEYLANKCKVGRIVWRRLYGGFISNYSFIIFYICLLLNARILRAFKQHEQSLSNESRLSDGRKFILIPANLYMHCIRAPKDRCIIPLWQQVFARLKIMPFTALAWARYHATMTTLPIALCGALTTARVHLTCP